MKTIRLTLLAIFLAASLVPFSTQAQNYSRAKGLARRVAPGPAPAPARGQMRSAPPTPAQTPAQDPTQTPVAPATPVQTPARPAPTRAYSPAVARPAAPADPVKAQAAKEEATKKTIEFQKRRAEEGSTTAQYDLGMRYLKGDGVEQDEAKGRELLETSAKNGNNQAIKKLGELDKDRKEPKEEK